MDAPALLTIIEDHGFQDLSSTVKVAFLNETYFELCTIEPWPFLETTFLLNFNGSSATPTDIPSDFGDVKFMQRVSDRAPITPLNLTEFRWQGYDPAETGDPRHYYFVGDTIYFYPVPPSGTDTVRMDYLKLPNTLTAVSTEAAILLPPRHHDALWLGVLVKLFGRDDDEGKMEPYLSLYQRKIAHMRNDLWRKQYQQPDYIKEVVWTDDDYYG